MKNLPEELERGLRDKITALLIFDQTGIVRKEASTKVIRNVVFSILQAVDNTVEKLCRPHDFVRDLDSPTCLICARCGEQALRHSNGNRLIVSGPLPKPVTPEEEALANVMGGQSGWVPMKKSEGEVRL